MCTPFSLMLLQTAEAVQTTDSQIWANFEEKSSKKTNLQEQKKVLVGFEALTSDLRVFDYPIDKKDVYKPKPLKTKIRHLRNDCSISRLSPFLQPSMHLFLLSLLRPLVLQYDRSAVY